VAVTASSQNVLVGAVSATPAGSCAIAVAPSSSRPLTANCGACSGITGNGMLGTPYSATLSADGGTGSYTYSIVSGSLPPGLTLNPSTGAITGTPTAAGIYTYAFKVTDSAGNTATAQCSILISKAYCTRSQYGWGSQPSGNNGGALLQQYFSKLYKNGSVSVGMFSPLNFTSAAAISAFLQNTGPIQPISSGATNPSRSSLPNQLAADLLALQLNVDFSNAGVTPAGLGTLKCQSGLLQGWAVQDVLNLGHLALVGMNWLPDVLLQDLDDIIESINNAFNSDGGGISNTGYLQ
jgi:hypothetical protein